MQDTNIQSVFNKQRSDKFRLILTLPKILRSMDTSDFSVIQKDLLNSDSLQFSLYAASVPGVSVPSKDVPFMGQTIRVTSQTRPAYEPITCKFAVDNRFRNYWVLWKWLESMNSPRESTMAVGLTEQNQYGGLGTLPSGSNLWDYQTTITLMPLDEYNKKMCEFIFYNAFITNLSKMDFNFQTEDEIQGDFTFTFGQMDMRLED